VREELSLRTRDGKSADKILGWLNLTRARDALAAQGLLGGQITALTLVS